MCREGHCCTVFKGICIVWKCLRRMYLHGDMCFEPQVMALSGIVALFFTGICHAHYSLYSVAPQAQITLRRFFEVAAFLCETFVFAYLGLQARRVSPCSRGEGF